MNITLIYKAFIDYKFSVLNSSIIKIKFAILGLTSNIKTNIAINKAIPIARIISRG